MVRRSRCGTKAKPNCAFRLHNLESIVAFGWDISASAQLMAACAEAGVTLSFCTPHGKFLAAATGFAPGNVLLRREQYRRADDLVACAAIARNIVAAKISSCRVSLLRALRDRPDHEAAFTAESHCTVVRSSRRNRLARKFSRRLARDRRRFRSRIL